MWSTYSYKQDSITDWLEESNIRLMAENSLYICTDYNIYMDIQQAINLEIYKKFEESDISFAYPTQTLLLEQSNGRKSVDGR